MYGDSYDTTFLKLIKKAGQTPTAYVRHGSFSAVVAVEVADETQAKQVLSRIKNVAHNFVKPELKEEIEDTLDNTLFEVDGKQGMLCFNTIGWSEDCDQMMGTHYYH